MFSVGRGGKTSPAAPSGSIQYNNGGAFGGSGLFNFNGVNAFQLTGSGGIAEFNLGTGANSGLLQMGGIGSAGSVIKSASNTFTLESDSGPLYFSNGLTNIAAFDTTGNFMVRTAGKGLQVAEGTGSDALQGTATLVAGTVTVANTHIAANCRIFLTSQVDGGTPGFLRVASRINGTSFTVTSSSNLDTSTFAFQIFTPPDL